MQTYLQYMTDNKYVNSNINELENLIPKQLFQEIVYSQTKNFLKTFKILKSINNPIVLRRISTLLKPIIFLKNDYIIYRNDVGEEMYFLVDGSVDVLSENEQAVLASLSSGIFGEIALLSENCKRTRSVIASQLTQVYLLEKKDLFNIFSDFPDLLHKFIQECDRKLQDINVREKQLRKAKRPLHLQSYSSDSSIEEEIHIEKLKKKNYIKKDTIRIGNRKKSTKIASVLTQIIQDHGKKDLNAAFEEKRNTIFNTQQFKEDNQLQNLENKMQNKNQQNNQQNKKQNQKQKLKKMFSLNEQDELNSSSNKLNQNQKNQDNNEQKFKIDSIQNSQNSVQVNQDQKILTEKNEKGTDTKINIQSKKQINFNLPSQTQIKINHYQNQISIDNDLQENQNQDDQLIYSSEHQKSQLISKSDKSFNSSSMSQESSDSDNETSECESIDLEKVRLAKQNQRNKHKQKSGKRTKQSFMKNKFNIKKIIYLATSFQESDDEILEEFEQIQSENLSMEEYIDENEMDVKKIPVKQSRRRFNPKNIKKERRLSRVDLGKQLQLSKYSGLSLNWGMSLANN